MGRLGEAAHVDAERRVRSSASSLIMYAALPWAVE
jgi:hypothetical protein